MKKLIWVTAGAALAVGTLYAVAREGITILKAAFGTEPFDNENMNVLTSDEYLDTIEITGPEDPWFPDAKF